MRLNEDYFNNNEVDVTGISQDYSYGKPEYEVIVYSQGYYSFTGEDVDFIKKRMEAVTIFENVAVERANECELYIGFDMDVDLGSNMWLKQFIKFFEILSFNFKDANNKNIWIKNSECDTYMRTENISSIIIFYTLRDGSYSSLSGIFAIQKICRNVFGFEIPLNRLKACLSEYVIFSRLQQHLFDCSRVMNKEVSHKNKLLYVNNLYLEPKTLKSVLSDDFKEDGVDISFYSYTDQNSFYEYPVYTLDQIKLGSSKAIVDIRKMISKCKSMFLDSENTYVCIGKWVMSVAFVFGIDCVPETNDYVNIYVAIVSGHKSYVEPFVPKLFKNPNNKKLFVK